MRQYFVYTLIVISLLFSCADNAEMANENRIATFEIEGMVCEMGCGASLRKGLYTTNAVDEVEIEYEEERKQNLIHVHYQADKTSTDEMKKLIEELNDGQFTCNLKEDKATEVDSSNSGEAENASISKGGVDGLEASTKNFHLPNLTELLNSLIY